MKPTKSAATESRKRKRGLDVNDLRKLFNTEPDNYEFAWNELKRQFLDTDEHARQKFPSVELQYLYYWYIRTNLNSLRRRRSLSLMHGKSLICAMLKMFFGLASKNYQYRSIFQRASTEFWQSPPKPIKRTKHSHGLL